MHRRGEIHTQKICLIFVDFIFSRFGFILFSYEHTNEFGFTALYGFLWTKESEAAFANYRLWESLGFIVAFATQNYLCTHVKIYICMVFLCAGMLLYGVVEVSFRREHNGATQQQQQHRGVTNEGFNTKI